MKFISKDGPITKYNTGKLDSRGYPILRPCTPFWVVRYWTGETSFADKKFFSEDSADRFIAELPGMADTGARGEIS